ncbi:AAA family ATPase [Polaromonas jejuensis]|uniref:AAA family ATPase n=1 Tax=Polaromonas jejuensis TaxID=457502 RepID=A0ABW0QE71_9BURK|nr:AAA family ATPase [Polaromonas jejuensis]
MNALEVFEKWLRSEYLEKLDVQLNDHLSPKSSAVWMRNGSDTHASLFDVDLGIWFKFVELIEPEKVSSRVQESIQASLADAAQLLWKTGLPGESQDRSGAWTLTLIFLIHSSCRLDWEKSIQTLRAESGFTEEFSIDVIVFNDPISLSTQLQSGTAMPQLLLSSRKLLLLPAQNIDSWLSADAEVKKLLDDLPNRFSNSQERKLVEGMIEQVLKDSSSTTDHGFPAAPLHLDSVKITSLRNISDFTLKLRSPDSDVFAHIIHGPNGTGKSSIFEALSIAVAGSSRRMADYLVDPDIYRPTSAAYVKNVLAPLATNQNPQVEVSGSNVLSNMPVDAQEADLRLIASDGTLLAQEDARNFVETPGRNLGARVLTGYSVLAQNVQSFCEREYGLANSKRQEWLRKFGIAASVTREESRLTKLIEHFIGQYHPFGTQQLGFWLAAIQQRIPNYSVEAKSLAFDWSEADAKSKRDDLAKIVVQLDRLGANAECERAVFGWIQKRNKALLEMTALKTKIKKTCDDITEQRPELEEDLQKWQRWLFRDTSTAAGSDTPSQEALSEEKNLNSQLQITKDVGLSYSEQLQHLKQVQSTFLSSWAKDHPELCPTCNADHSLEGGIVSVVKKLSEDLELRLGAARKQYAEILSKVRELQKSHEQLGQCPLNEERRSAIAHLLGFTDQGYEALESFLKQKDAVDILLQSLDLLISPPQLPLIDDTEVAASRVWSEIETENARGAALWALPDRWSNIRKVVDSECLLIIQRHLPKTLQAVWAEIAMTITPARWNLADQPRLIAESKRGSESLRILVGDDKRQIGVQHIFNQAENHILGLAWFFTRYLSSGRFKHSLVALDDPAQEMDQTTFRSFTRLIQTFCRLHERYGRPLTLVLLLHQEDRALDAARATNHQVTSLKWAREISSSASVEHLILISPEFKAPLPKVLQSPKLNSQTAPA